MQWAHSENLEQAIWAGMDARYVGIGHSGFVARGCQGFLPYGGSAIG